LPTLLASTILFWSPESCRSEKPPPSQPADEAAKLGTGGKAMTSMPIMSRSLRQRPVPRPRMFFLVPQNICVHITYLLKTRKRWGIQELLVFAFALQLDDVTNRLGGAQFVRRCRRCCPKIPVERLPDEGLIRGTKNIGHVDIYVEFLIVFIWTEHSRQYP